MEGRRPETALFGDRSRPGVSGQSFFLMRPVRLEEEDREEDLTALFEPELFGALTDLDTELLGEDVRETEVLARERLDEREELGFETEEGVLDFGACRTEEEREEEDRAPKAEPDERPDDPLATPDTLWLDGYDL